jgi:hypothetical protein
MFFFISWFSTPERYLISEKTGLLFGVQLMDNDAISYLAVNSMLRSFWENGG